MPKRAIPSLPKSSIGSDRRVFDEAVKENLEVIMGQRGEKLLPLPTTATQADIIERVNALLARLQ